MDTQIILPSFHGFYDSIWSALWDNDLEDLAQEHHVTELDGWVAKDIKGTEQEICERYAALALDEMNSALGLNLVAKLVDVWSPREYNFYTDRIYVSIDISDEDVERVVHLMLADYNRLQNVIHDRHTSHSGFISFMSNDIDDWLKIFTADARDEDFGLYLGYVLFYLWDGAENFEDIAYEWISGNVYAEHEPYTEAAKREWAKVQIAEEYLGWGGYDPDKMASYSPEGLKFRLEKQKWESEHLLGIEFAY